MAKFKLSLSRNVGGQLYEAATEVEVDAMLNPGERLKIIDTANDQLNFLLDRYAATIVPQQRNPNTVTGQLASGQTPSNLQSETFPAKWLNVSMHNGKRHYKVTTEKIKPYGVPIYEETLKEAGFVPDEIPNAGLSLEEYLITCSKVGGKHTKVLKLEVEF